MATLGRLSRGEETKHMNMVLIVLLFAGGEMVLDASTMYNIETLSECYKILPTVIEEYNIGNNGYCAIGDILNKIEEV